MPVIGKSIVSILSISAAFFAAGYVAIAQAHGAADPLGAYYANTWEFKDDEGFKLLHINKSRSMQVKLSDGRVFDGTWDRKDKEVCFYVGNDKACFDDLLGRKANEKWTGIHDEHSYTGILHEGRETFLPSTESE